MAWSPQQEDALRGVRLWLRTLGSQVFYLAGFAGTGKTTLARAIVEDVRGRTLFAAFTGKAALVLRRKGCEDASTIHSMIYKPHREDLDGQPTWRLDPNSDARYAGLIIVDECSMVDERLGRDLLSYGTKVLVLGDPMQLPPVSGGEGFFTAGRPDFTLTEIHRQARDNPIIHLSMIVREGGRLMPGRYGESVVLAPSDRDGLDQARVLAADQILVGTNKKRARNNRIYRKVTGKTGDMPRIGEKLVCLKNDHERKLLNGGLWSVDDVISTDSRNTRLVVQSDDDDDAYVQVRVPNAFFTGDEDKLDWVTKKHNDQFTFGYALTVHKAQGSQWNDVVLFDESPVFRENRTKHLYTGLTRAAEKVVVVQ